MSYEDAEVTPLQQHNIDHCPSENARVKLGNVPKEFVAYEGLYAVVLPGTQKNSSQGTKKVPPLLLLLYLHLSLPRRFVSR